MALSQIEGFDNLFVGGLWSLRRSDALAERKITHVLSVVGFDPSSMKNFKEEPWTVYGKAFEHLVIDVDDVDDTDLLIEMPRAVRFIDAGLAGKSSTDTKGDVAGTGAVFVHCVAGKSRSVSMIVAYLLWRYPEHFDPDPVKSRTSAGRIDTADAAVAAALELVRRSRPMAQPNDGFMDQLSLWWAMGCPQDVEGHPGYQRWAFKREVEENVAVGQAPSRLRFEDEHPDFNADGGGDGGAAERVSLRCKKCRRTLATTPFIAKHNPTVRSVESTCPHYLEPLSWMRAELEKGQLSGRLACPNERCGASVGRYDWKGFKCGCGAWITPAFSLQRSRVDEMKTRVTGTASANDNGGTGGDHVEDEKAAARRAMGIRMPPGRGAGNL